MSEPIQTPTTTTVSDPAPVKTFTQEEVDAMIGKRLAKAMKGIPSEEELNAYRTWKDGQQTEQQRRTILISMEYKKNREVIETSRFFFLARKEGFEPSRAV